MGSQELLTEKVTVRFGGDEYSVPKDATEDQIRAGLQKAGIPEAANARIVKDEETGDWTVTREAGQKGL